MPWDRACGGLSLRRWCDSDSQRSRLQVCSRPAPPSRRLPPPHPLHAGNSIHRRRLQAFLTQQQIKGARFWAPIRNCMPCAFIITYKRAFLTDVGDRFLFPPRFDQTGRLLAAGRRSEDGSWMASRAGELCDEPLRLVRPADRACGITPSQSQCSHSNPPDPICTRHSQSSPSATRWLNACWTSGCPY